MQQKGIFEGEKKTQTRANWENENWWRGGGRYKEWRGLGIILKGDRKC